MRALSGLIERPAGWMLALMVIGTGVAATQVSRSDSDRGSDAVELRMDRPELERATPRVIYRVVSGDRRPPPLLAPLPAPSFAPLLGPACPVEAEPIAVPAPAELPAFGEI